MEFLIVPDIPGMEPYVGDLARTIPHASGRPWIIGHWADHEVVRAARGTKQIALLGWTNVSRARLEAALADVDRLRDFDDLARTLPGSFHLVCVVNGTIRAQGTISSDRQIFYTTTRDGVLAGNRPDLLTSATGRSRGDGLGVAPEILAMRLATPTVPYPLSEIPVWQEVEAVGCGEYLELGRTGLARTVRWWRTPEPEVPIAEGAVWVSQAVRDAVSVRAELGGTISADLSGGMDSTGICFVAAGAGTKPLTTVHVASGDAGNDDAMWASEAAAAMPRAEHVVRAPGTTPSMFQDIAAPDVDADEPLPWLRMKATTMQTAQLVAERRSTAHLTGEGGDELFLATPPYLHTLARRHPVAAWRKVRTDRAMHRWPLGATVRGLLNRQSYGEWLASLADGLAEPIAKPTAPQAMAWGGTIRMPSWVTADAADAVRDRLRAAAATEPLSWSRAQHWVLFGVRKGGEANRQIDRLVAESGVSWHAPYLDDQVVRAALSVRLPDRADPYAYKPVLEVAMRGIMPDRLRGRRTKAEFSRDLYAGFRENRSELLELCDDMRLARFGLVDADAFRSALLGLYPRTSAWRCWNARCPARRGCGRSPDACSTVRRERCRDDLHPAGRHHRGRHRRRHGAAG